MQTYFSNIQCEFVTWSKFRNSFNFVFFFFEGNAPFGENARTPPFVLQFAEFFIKKILYSVSQIKDMMSSIIFLNGNHSFLSTLHVATKFQNFNSYHLQSIKQNIHLIFFCFAGK